jgi:hypothetical protein
MRWKRACSRLAVLGLAVLDSSWVLAAPPVDLRKDGTLAIAGRSLKCGSVRNILDPRLPNLGVAARGVVVFNPTLLGRQSDTVRLFVFHHECGHHHVGGSEMGADCWAVKQGVQAGWLNRAGLGEVCRSFGNAPQTPTHPSGASRCASLRLCFATAMAAQQQVQPRKSVLGQAGAGPAAATPKLVAEPKLVRAGFRK